MADIPVPVDIDNDHVLDFDPPTPVEHWSTSDDTMDHSLYSSSESDYGVIVSSDEDDTRSLDENDDSIDGQAPMEFHLNFSAYLMKTYHIPRLTRPWDAECNEFYFVDGESYFRLAHRERNEGLAFDEGLTFPIKVNNEKVNFGMLMRYCYSYLLTQQVQLLAQEGCPGKYVYSKCCAYKYDTEKHCINLYAI